MNWAATVLAFIQAFPRFVGLLERFANYFRDKDLNKWLDQVEGGINDLEKAQSAEQKLAAARTLVDAIRKLS